MRRQTLLVAAAVITACGTARSTASSTSPTNGNGPTTSGSSSTGAPTIGVSAESTTDPSTDAGIDGENVRPPIPYVDRDINHVLITGQSNAVANEGKPILSTSQPYANLMFSSGTMPGTACDGEGCKSYEKPTALVPLVEGDNFFSWPVETASSGLANGISFFSGKKSHVLTTLHGRSGNTYWCLRKGGCPYKVGYLAPFTQAMSEVADAKTLAAASGQSYVVRAVATIHGESDHYSYTDGSEEFPLDGTDGTPDEIATYADALVEWQRDYETEVRKLTGQTEAVPLLVSQISGWNDTAYSKVAEYELDAHIAAPDKVVLIGPSYQLSFAADCRHFDGVSERRLGEYFAKVYQRVIIEGRHWEPVRPRAVTRSGNVVTVKFFVPVPPLAIDTDRVAAIESFGFAYSASPITKVEVTSADTVTVTLANGAPGHLTYAQNQTPNTCIGTPRGARGNLRDSDETKSPNGYDLHDWAVHFDVAVP